jgi:4-amino-4-deoxy-L-arabinose transferase-like glycosyltransferase
VNPFRPRRTDLGSAQRVSSEATAEDRRVTLGLAVVLLLAVVIRLPGLTSPPTGHHAWRQSDSAGIARNFAEEQYDILHPRIDWRGDTEGLVESEFPIYPFVVATLYKAIGVHEWLARLTSVVFLVAAIVYLWRLVRSLTDARTAIWSALFLAVLPMPLYFGRAIMNEALLLAACAGTAWHFHRWLETRRPTALLPAVLLLTLACLLKPFTLWMALPLLVLGLATRGSRWLTRWELWTGGLFIVGCATAWFVHAGRLGGDTGLTFGIWTYGADKWGQWALAFSGEFWHKLLVERLPKDYLAWGGIPAFFTGLFAARRSPAGRLFAAWIVALLIVSVVVSQGTFAHDYYWLPMSLPVAFFVGQGYSRYARKDAWYRPAGLLLAVGLVAMGIVVTDDHGGRLRRERTEAARYEELASLVEETLRPDELVVALDRRNPVMLYMVGRKGWQAYPETLRQSDLEAAAAKGARAVIGFRRDYALLRERGVQHASSLRRGRASLNEAAIVVPMRVPMRQRRSDSDVQQIPQ